MLKGRVCSSLLSPTEGEMFPKSTPSLLTQGRSSQPSRPDLIRAPTHPGHPFTCQHSSEATQNARAAPKPQPGVSEFVS